MATVLERRAARQLYRAADRIEHHGWVQGEHGLHATGFDVVGAIKPPQNNPHPDTVELAIATAAWASGPPIWGMVNSPRRQLEVWNDEPGRNKEQAVKLLRRAAKQLDPHTSVTPWWKTWRPEVVPTP